MKSACQALPSLSSPLPPDPIDKLVPTSTEQAIPETPSIFSKRPSVHLHYTTCGIYCGPHFDKGDGSKRCCAPHAPHVCCARGPGDDTPEFSAQRRRILTAMLHQMPSGEAQQGLADCLCYTACFNNWPDSGLREGKGLWHTQHPSMMSCRHIPGGMDPTVDSHPDGIGLRDINNTMAKFEDGVVSDRVVFDLAAFGPLTGNGSVFGGEPIWQKTGDAEQSAGFIFIANRLRLSVFEPVQTKEPVEDLVASEYDAVAEFYVPDGDTESDTVDFDVDSHESESSEDKHADESKNTSLWGRLTWWFSHHSN